MTTEHYSFLLVFSKDSAVEPDDLFESLQSAAKENVALPLSTTVGAIMNPWVYQSGYPLVTVTRLPGTNTFEFKQEHFTESLPDSRTWWIPITYKTKSNQNARDETKTEFWIPEGSSSANYNLSVPNDTYLLINPHQTGYYRVNYDQELWKKLIDQLITNHTEIPPVSRAQLIDDSMKLSLARKLDVAVSFDLFKYLSKELDFVPWYTALSSSNLQYINKALVTDEAAYNAFKVRGWLFLNSY